MQTAFNLFGLAGFAMSASLVAILGVGYTQWDGIKVRVINGATEGAVKAVTEKLTKEFDGKFDGMVDAMPKKTGPAMPF